jgi:uncharacterized protein
MARPGYYSCALITGASAGLGEEFALQLAPRVRKLVLVARRESRLNAVADLVRSRHPEVAVAIHALDLANAGERQRLVAELEESGFVPDLLVNNAGFGDYGEFATADWPKLEGMLRLNIEALTHLTHAFLPSMIRRGGAVVNVSSIASLIPIRDFAVYAASKAYVTSFSESLRMELRQHGIPVVAVCPGPVRTEFGSVSRRTEDAPGMPPARDWFYVPKWKVVAEAIRGLDRDRARVFPGLKMAAAALLLAALPVVCVRLAMSSDAFRRG